MLHICIISNWSYFRKVKLYLLTSLNPPRNLFRSGNFGLKFSGLGVDTKDTQDPAKSRQNHLELVRVKSGSMNFRAQILKTQRLWNIDTNHSKDSWYYGKMDK